MVKVRPRNDQVVVKRDKPAEVSAGGIHLALPVDADQEPAQGEVVAVGPGKRTPKGVLVPPSVKVGDRVLVGHYAGETYEVSGNRFVLIKDEEILGKVLG